MLLTIDPIVSIVENSYAACCMLSTIYEADERDIDVFKDIVHSQTLEFDWIYAVHRPAYDFYLL